MKFIPEIADEYACNLVLLRQRRDALKAQAKAERNAELRLRLWRRVYLLDCMIMDGARAVHLMRDRRHGE
nr:hypothetical protein [uncultured Agathobaculum sp.]